MKLKKFLQGIARNSTVVIESRKSAKITLATNAYYDGSFNIAKEGYKPIAIVGYHCEWYAGQTSLLNIYNLIISGSEVSFAVRNMHTSNTQFDLLVQVLYQKIG